MPAREAFRWQHQLFDISALLTDIAQGRLVPQEVELNEEFVRTYCGLYLEFTSQVRPPLHVNLQYAQQLPQERLQEPVVLLHVGEGEGLVSFREDEPEPHYVVADGNHRLIAASQRGSILRAYVIAREIASQYELPNE